MPMQSTVKQAGFVLNTEKSTLKPTQQFKWLGFVVDLAQRQIEVPDDKLARLFDTLQSPQHASQISAR